VDTSGRRAITLRNRATKFHDSHEIREAKRAISYKPRKSTSRRGSPAGLAVADRCKTAGFRDKFAAKRA